jgi:diguanylate cyclase (GGDEF)-like protein
VDAPPSEVLRRAADGEVLQDAAHHLCRLLGVDRASILLVDEGTLRHAAAVGLPSDYTAAIDGIAIGPDVGCCGAAAYHGTAQVTEDVLVDPRWDRFRDLATAAGLRACWSVPMVLPEGEVLGTFAVYDAAPYAPSAEQLRTAASYASLVALSLGRLRAQSTLTASYEAVVAALTSALDARDDYTGRHSSATAELACSVGRRLHLDDTQLAMLRQVAVLHDIGKLGIPNEILGKPGPLGAEEWALMREHPIIGERILSGIPQLAEVAKAIRHEHERWDGTGYPDGVAGEQIPLASRVVFACDAWHAMTSDRPYRPAMPREDALRQLRDCAGTQFDPRVAHALLETLGDDGPPPGASPRESHEQARDAELAALAAELGATDLFVFRHVAGGLYTHLGGVGRGAGWAGNIEISSDDEAHVRMAVDEQAPICLSLPETGRILGPYWGRSAVVVPFADETVVVFGAADDALAGACTERATELARDARALVDDVSPAKRLADELEVLDAVRAVTTISSDTVEGTLNVLADRAAAALSCEFGAVMTLPSDEVDLALGWADRGWRPPDVDATRRALTHFAGRLHDLPVLCQDTEAVADSMPEGFRRDAGASSIHVLPIGRPAVALLLVVHAEPGLRGFTALCQRVARAMSDGAEVVVRRALAQERLASENAALAQRLRTDVLTGVASRAAWEETIRAEELHRARGGQPVSVVVVDLDDLKAINDRDGHQAGDQALRACAAVLSDVVRATDVVARLGGDEFGVLLRYTDGEQAKAWCARLEARLTRERPAPLGCSLGTASAPPHATLAEALAEADRQMYAAKARNRRGRAGR